MHLFLTAALLVTPAAPDPVPVVTPIPVVVVLPVETPPARDYAACLAAVDRGETVYLCVDVYTTQGEYFVPELPGIKAGVYECKLIDGRRDMLAVDPKTHKPLVTPAAQAGPRNPADPNEDHRCPFCGTYQYVHSRTMPDGSHDHTCNNPNCPHRKDTGSPYTWTHGGPLGYPGTRGQGGVKAAPVQPQYTQPRPSYQPQFQPFGGGIQFGLSAPGMSFGGCVGGG